MRQLPRSYFLSPTAIARLRRHKKWSLDRFGRAATKKYFQDMDKGFQYIADNYKRFPQRSKLTGEIGLFIYPVREHYVVFVPMNGGIHIADILGQAQDIPHILNENIETFRRELVRYAPTGNGKRKGRKHV